MKISICAGCPEADRCDGGRACDRHVSYCPLCQSYGVQVKNSTNPGPHPHGLTYYNADGNIRVCLWCSRCAPREAARRAEEQRRKQNRPGEDIFKKFLASEEKTKSKIQELCDGCHLSKSCTDSDRDKVACYKSIRYCIHCLKVGIHSEHVYQLYADGSDRRTCPGCAQRDGE